MPYNYHHHDDTTPSARSSESSLTQPYYVVLFSGYLMKVCGKFGSSSRLIDIGHACAGRRVVILDLILDSD